MLHKLIGFPFIMSNKILSDRHIFSTHNPLDDSLAYHQTKRIPSVHIRFLKSAIGSGDFILFYFLIKEKDWRDKF